jgi:hypothetical protein
VTARVSAIFYGNRRAIGNVRGRVEGGYRIAAGGLGVVIGGVSIDAAGTAGYIPNGSTIVSVADGTTTIGGVPTPILVFNFGGTDNVCVIAPKAPELPAPPWLTPLTVPWPLLEPQLPALVVLRLLWLP